MHVFLCHNQAVYKSRQVTLSSYSLRYRLLLLLLLLPSLAILASATTCAASGTTTTTCSSTASSTASTRRTSTATSSSAFCGRRWVSLAVDGLTHGSSAEAEATRLFDDGLVDGRVGLVHVDHVLKGWNV